MIDDINLGLFRVNKITTNLNYFKVYKINTSSKAVKQPPTMLACSKSVK